MQRFTYDLLHDVTEDTEIIESTELVRSIQIPAYASDEQTSNKLISKINDNRNNNQYNEQCLKEIVN